MNLAQLMRWFAIATFSLVFAAGCASTPEEAPAEEPKMEATDAKKAEAEAAIAAAKAAVDKAASVGGLWRDTQSILASAEEAYAAGDYDRAIELANKAREQAELGYAQAMAERERLAREAAEAAKMPSSYTVESGDNLWNISGKDDIYADPYQWPLIYKANQDQIKDADLIFPGQNLAIDRDASQGDIDAAISHAKNRGAWSLGQVEQSDKDYAAQ